MFEDNKDITVDTEFADISGIDDFIAPPQKRISFINILTMQAIICTVLMIGAVLLGTFAPSAFEYCRRNYQTLVSADAQTFVSTAKEKFSEAAKVIKNLPQSGAGAQSEQSSDSSAQSSDNAASQSSQISSEESGVSSEQSKAASDSLEAEASAAASGTGGTPQAIQKLGEIPAGATVLPVSITIDFTRPTKTGTISSYFGQRIHPITGEYEFHTALDIAAAKNTPVYSVADGTVIESGKDKYLGKYVYIEHADGFQSKYGHLNKRCVKKGKKVKAGELIGKVGTTGYSTGFHLHLQLLKNKVAFNPLFVFKYA